MMKWADFQSVIQLVVALNTIYLSLRDIRIPVLRKEEEILRQFERNVLSKDHDGVIDDNIAINEIEEKVIVLIAKFEQKKTEFEVSDAITRKISVATAIVYSVIIVFSAYSAKEDISGPMAITVSTVGFLPLLLGLRSNISLVKDIGVSITIERQRLEALFFALRRNRIREK